VLITEKTMEFDAVVIRNLISLRSTRTVVPSIAVLETMLTVGALKLPSLLSCGEMRQREGNRINK